MARKLIGEELLQYCRDHEGQPLAETIRETGYVNSKGGLYKTKFMLAPVSYTHLTLPTKQMV